MKTLAGFTLKKRNANNVPVIIPSRVVAKYHPYANVITDITPSSTIIIPAAKPSSQSVMLIAFTIAIVRKNVSIG